MIDDQSPVAVKSSASQASQPKVSRPGVPRSGRISLAATVVAESHIVQRSSAQDSRQRAIRASLPPACPAPTAARSLAPLILYFIDQVFRPSGA
jgi:hypothetical protein